LNGTNVNHIIVSYGNLSPNWGPFDPLPFEPSPVEPSEIDGVTSASLPGDANDDGIVDLADFSILATVFGTADSSADFDGDGLVTLTDFSILAANFGKRMDDVATAPMAMRKQSFRTPVSHFTGCLSMRMPAKRLRRGDMLEVTVMAEDVSLKAYSFALSYDDSMLRLLKDGIVEGDFLKDALFVAAAGEDAPDRRPRAGTPAQDRRLLKQQRYDVRVFSAVRSGASKGTGVLAKLRFMVVEDGASNDAIALRDVQVVDGAGRLTRLPELHVSPSPLRATATGDATTVPHKTRLLANYPNPFNPETWIPFELSKDANVKLQIYNVSGCLIRTLDLGYRPAGHYVDCSTAAYWDGRNNAGERVASSIYLYRLTAGDFSAVRKMLILK